MAQRSMESNVASESIPGTGTGTSNTRPNGNQQQQQQQQRRKNDLSFSVVWSPLFPITIILPFIGHLGIATSHGVPNDFQGPYYVGTDGRMAFGPPTRYLKVDASDLPEQIDQWDTAIAEANDVYSRRMHNIFCDNCHSHVAYAMNLMPLKAYGVQKWDMVKLCFLVFFRGRYVSWWGVVTQFVPFLLWFIPVMYLVTL